MKAREFIVEVATHPYDIHFSNNVSFKTKTLRGSKGAKADFTTDAGIKYLIHGYKIGATQEERAALAKEKEHLIALRNSGKPARYPIPMDSRIGGIWEIHFGQGDTPEAYKSKLTGSGDEFRVFATVIEFLSRIIGEFHPQIISIKSDNAEKSRAGLYNKLAQRFAKTLGYEVTKSVDTGTKTRLELRKIDV